MTTAPVPPQSWYSNLTPSTVQRWKVPCCRRCHNDLNRIESDLRVRLGLSINPNTDEAAGVASTARPTLGLDVGNLPEKEKGRRDRIRANARADLMAYGEVVETPGLIPGLVPHPANVSESPVLPMLYPDLTKIGGNFGRGCEYQLLNRYVEPPYGLRTFINHPDEIRAEFDGEQLFDLGPGFKVKCVRNAENPGDVAYWFLLWDTICLKVFITFESVLIELEPKFSRPPVEVAGTIVRTDSPQQQSVSAQMSIPDWKQCEGEVAGGRFPLDRFLGSSETSAVFLTRSGSGAAVIQIEAADDDQASVLVERWNRAAALHHPHLSGILAVGTWVLAGMTLAYLVMEYAEENLAEALRDRPITADEAREMLLPVAEALAYLHSQGLVHGNLKPSNILAVGDTVKITRESASAGDPAEDIWALGTTVLQAFTQRAGTVAPSVQDPAIDSLPSPFREILQHCLAEDPRLRWSADKIAASLRSPQPLVSTLPAAATAGAKPSTRELRRWYYVAGFTLIVAASAVVGLLVMPRTAARVVLTSEPVRPLATSASPGTAPSGPTPAGPSLSAGSMKSSAGLPIQEHGQEVAPDTQTTEPVAGPKVSGEPTSTTGETIEPDSTSAPATPRSTVLRLKGKGSVVVLGREAVATLELSQHPERLRKLIGGGSLFTVQRGTAIKLLQGNRLETQSVIKVLIMEGSKVGQEGWAQTWQVSP